MFFLSLFERERERERERASAQGRGREGGAEPDVGLKLTKREIMT